MKKYIFYQTNKSLWFCKSDNRPSYVYEKEIKPIRLLILEVTDNTLVMLIDLFEDDKNMFTKIIEKELNENFNTLYMN